MSEQRERFRTTLSRGPLLADGAMGTLLAERGAPWARPFDEQNLVARNRVLTIHRDYVRAGARLITTNTFGSNRVRLSSFGLSHEVHLINRTAARIAREAREIEGEDVLVAGSIGPLGLSLTAARITREEARSNFREQAAGLLEGGVDLFIIETFSSLEEIEAAVIAVRNLCDLPVIASMTFGEDGMTSGGVTPEAAARALDRLGVDVIGVNCSVGPAALLEVVRKMHDVSPLPLSAMPNAGLPSFRDGKYVYAAGPDYFAEYAARFLSAGVSILGGCCGTTPEHIAAMRPVVEGRLVPKIELLVEPEPTVEIEAPPVIEEERPLSLQEKLGRTFVISVEVDPPRGSNPRKMLVGGRRLAEAGVDAINVADSPMARVRMGAVAASKMLQDETGVPVVLHFACRDRNLMGLQSDLLGAHALGIRAVLAVTGDPPSVGDYPHATAVYDIDSIGLIGVLARMNRGEDALGNSIGRATNFLIGCGVNPAADDLEYELERFERKVAAGAQFAFTQPVYELDVLDAFLSRVKHVEIPILLGVLPLVSYRHAEFLHHEVPGIVVSEDARRRMREAGEKGIEEGRKMALEFLRLAMDRVSGAYLMPSFGRYEDCAVIVEEMR
jgi:methionine synthase I (cobalamin-dependent)/5,10-methylenetetrahydrofolate reductase